MALSEAELYQRKYGKIGAGVSPEVAWQMTQRLQAGQDVMDGKYGKGLPELLGVQQGPNGTAMAGGGAGGLTGAFQSAQDAANAANESRYKDILGKLTENRNNAKGLIERTIAPGIRSDLDRRQTREINARRMNDAARGLLRSGAGMSKTAVADRQGELTRAEGELALKQAMMDSDNVRDITGFMERKNERGPDLKQLIDLEKGMGQAGPPAILGNPYGMGGGGGGPGGVMPMMVPQQQTMQPSDLAARMRGNGLGVLGTATTGVSPQGVPIRDQGPSGAVSFGKTPASVLNPAPQSVTPASVGNSNVTTSAELLRRINAERAANPLWRPQTSGFARA